jgi:hypothetical protein
VRKPFVQERGSGFEMILGEGRQSAKSAKSANKDINSVFWEIWRTVLRRYPGLEGYGFLVDALSLSLSAGPGVFIFWWGGAVGIRDKD